VLSKYRPSRYYTNAIIFVILLREGEDKLRQGTRLTKSLLLGVRVMPNSILTSTSGQQLNCAGIRPILKYCLNMISKFCSTHKSGCTLFS